MEKRTCLVVDVELDSKKYDQCVMRNVMPGRKASPASMMISSSLCARADIVLDDLGQCENSDEQGEGRALDSRPVVGSI